MRLRTKTLLVLAIAFVALFGVLHWSAAEILEKGFQRLERQDLEENLARVREAYANELDKLGQKVSDWGVWDDTYQYLHDRNTAYERSNLTAQPFLGMHIDFLALLDAGGRAVWASGFDRATSRLRSVEADETADFEELHGILRRSEDRDVVLGLYRVGGEWFNIAAHRVLRSDHSGPERGTVVFARAVDAEAIRQLAQLTKVDLRRVDPSEGGVPPELDQVGAMLGSPGEDAVPGFVFLREITGSGGVTLAASFPRAIVSEGRRSERYLFFALLSAGLISATVLVALLEGLVLRRLGKMSEEVRAIGESGVASARLTKEGGDELATLADRVNGMLDELERAERQVRESERKFLVMADTAPVLIRIADPRGESTFFNKAWTEFAGRGDRDEEGTGWLDRVHPEDRSRYHEAEQEAARNRTAFVIEFRLRRFDGDYRWILETRAPRFGNDNAFLGTIGSAVDITDRKQLEGALLQAKDAAEDAARSKADFLAKMSHELRTPMNGVIGTLDLGLQTQLSPEQREYLNVARTSAANLLGLLNDILDFSKLEVRRLELERIPLSLGQVMRESLDVVIPEARRKKIDLRTRIGGDVPDGLRGDPLRLRQVLVNLLGNAIKFTEEGSVTLAVTLRSRSAREAKLEIAVEDTGIGIAKKKLETIFEAFSQADGSITRRFGGTGLGLAISAQIVNLMGGRIEVESEVGKGSCFKFTVDAPLDLAAPAQLAREVVGRRPGVESWDSARRELSILVVDDNDTNRLVAARMLEKKGHRVVQASGGAEAVEKALAGGFDLILMDVQMPEVDGLEATRRIRAAEGREGDRVPILALTAQAMFGDRERCGAAGMDGYVTKPIQATALFEAIETCTRRQAAPRPT